MSERSLQHKESFITPILKQNPLFVSILGTCPALAVTKSLEASFGMGLLFTFVVCCSNVLISALRKLIPEDVRTPCYIVIIAAFVTITRMLTEAFLPELYSSLGVFLALLVVNCIVLGRAEAFASKNTVFDSLLDGLGNGVGYTWAICLIGVIREILGTGMITFGKIFTFIPLFRIPILKALDGSFNYSMSVFSLPTGGFIVFGLILAVIAAMEGRKKAKEKIKLQAEMKPAVKGEK
jgi:electron transport complex protein RnfE